MNVINRQLDIDTLVTHCVLPLKYTSFDYKERQRERDRQTDRQTELTM